MEYIIPAVSAIAWRVRGGDGSLSNNDVDASYVVRPALNLNLSQIKFTIV